MEKQTIRFKRIQCEGVRLPTYGTSQADCFDFYLPNETTINAESSVVIKTGLVALIPNGYAMHIYPRSGLSIKQGIVLKNLTGIIDSDYTDELLVALQNTTKQVVVLKAGDRIAQGRLVESVQHDIVESFADVEKIGNRVGGLGSTGA